MHYKGLFTICQILALFLLTIKLGIVSEVFASANPHLFYEVALDLERRTLLGRAQFKLPEKKLYFVKLSKSKVTSISAKNTFHHLQESSGDTLLSFFPLRSEVTVEIQFERSFTLKALLEGDCIPEPFPYLVNEPFTYEVKAIMPSLKADLRVFLSADFVSEDQDDKELRLKFINKSPVRNLPTLIIGPYRKEVLSGQNFNLNFLLTEKSKENLLKLKNGLSHLVDKIGYVSFTFRDIYLAYGLEELLLPGLMLISSYKDYSPQELASLLLLHELQHGRVLESPIITHGLALYLGAHELSSDQAGFRKKLLLSEDERALSFFRIYEIAQSVGEPSFKVAAIEYLSGKISLDTFLKRYRVAEEVEFSGIALHRQPMEIKAHLKSYQDGEKHWAEILITTAPFSNPFEVELSVEGESSKELKKIKVSSNTEVVKILLHETNFKDISLDPYYRLFRKLSPEEIPRSFESLMSKPLTIILPNRNLITRYQPLLNFLRDRNPKVKISALEDIVLEQLPRENILFLHEPPQNYYLNLPEKGLYVKLLPHPEEQTKTIAFVRTESAAELAKAIRAISSWKAAEEAHVLHGRVKLFKKPQVHAGLRLRRENFFGIRVADLFPLDRVIPYLLSARVILIGEEHTEYAHHLFQLEVLKKLHHFFPNIVVGVEMVQRPFQRVLDDFINGKILEEAFLKGSEYFDRWGYDWRLYRDIFLWVREKRIKMLALDLPSELVRKVHNEGLDALTDPERKELPETDFEQPTSYRLYLKQVHAQHNFTDNRSDFTRFYKAQILRDEAMAETLVNFLAKNPNHKAVVLVGKGHILNRWGLFHALQRRLKQPVVSIILGDVPELSPKAGDFLFQLPRIDYRRTPLLGLSLEELSEDLKVKEVKEGSLAGKIGLKPGDILLEIEGRRIAKTSDLRLVLSLWDEKKSLRVKVKRGDEILDLRLD